MTNCICTWSGSTDSGPDEDCPVHGRAGEFDHLADGRPAESALTRNAAEYRRREVAVSRGSPTCGDRGPNKARCILPPGHPGTEHEGNGFDVWGPMYRAWISREDNP